MFMMLLLRLSKQHPKILAGMSLAFTFRFLFLGM